MKFHCDNCDRKLSVPDKHAGRKAKCPHCGQALVIPHPVIELTDPSPKPKLSVDDPRLLQRLPEETPEAYGPTRPMDARDSADGNAARRSPNDLRLLDVLPSDVSETREAASDENKDGVANDDTPTRSPNDLRLLAAPPVEASETDSTDEAYEHLQSLQGGVIGKDRKDLPQRTRPWMVDIFLYPMNRAAMIMLLICVGIPFLLRIVLTFFKVTTTLVQIMIIFWLVSILIHWAVLSFLVLYMNWYIWECIRDSAGGGIRGAETVGTTPGFGEIIGQAFKGAVGLGLCMAPAIFYLGKAHTFDPAFWVLFAIGGFAFPMALLALVVHDAFSALNPLLIARSILKTFVSYVALVPFCYALCLLFPVAYYFILDTRYWHWSYVLQFAAFYLMLVMAHLLGRFYFKNEERLYWDA